MMTHQPSFRFSSIKLMEYQNTREVYAATFLLRSLMIDIQKMSQTKNDGFCQFFTLKRYYFIREYRFSLR